MSEKNEKTSEDNQITSETNELTSDNDQTERLKENQKIPEENQKTPEEDKKTFKGNKDTDNNVEYISIEDIMLYAQIKHHKTEIKGFRKGKISLRILMLYDPGLIDQIINLYIHRKQEDLQKQNKSLESHEVAFETNQVKITYKINESIVNT